MKILVTGASGFVGSHLTRALLARNDEVHIVLRESSRTWRIDDILPRLTVHRADLTDRKDVRRISDEFQPDAIYHLANAGVYGGISAGFQELFSINTIGLLNLLETFGDYRAFINIGSSSEYGSKSEPMKEIDRCEPLSVYGVSKLAATLTASFEARIKNRPIATFRLFSPYGPFDDRGRLISRAILSFSRAETFTLPHPEAVRDYIFIDDIVSLLADVPTTIAPNSGEVFNLGSGTEVHVRDVVHTIARIMGKQDLLTSLPPGSGVLGTSESPCWQADMTKTHAAFAWRPQHSLEAGLSTTIDWFLKHGEQYAK